VSKEGKVSLATVQHQLKHTTHKKWDAKLARYKRETGGVEIPQRRRRRTGGVAESGNAKWPASKNANRLNTKHNTNQQRALKERERDRDWKNDRSVRSRKTPFRSS